MPNIDSTAADRTSRPGKLRVASVSSARATARRRLLADKAARWVVTVGGLGIIVSILGILAFIGLEVLPLLRPAEVELLAVTEIRGGQARIAVGDEHRTFAVSLDADAVVRIIDIGAGSVVGEQALELPANRGVSEPGPEAGVPDSRPALTLFDQPSPSTLLAATTDDGWAVLVSVDFPVRFEEDRRITEPRVGEPVWLRLSEAPRNVRAFAARGTPDGGTSVAAQFDDGEVLFISREIETNMFSGEETESLSRVTTRTQYRLTRLEISGTQRELFGGTESGELLWWSLSGEDLGTPRVVAAGPAEITALDSLLGNRSILVGQADGSLGVWSQVRRGSEVELDRIRDFPPRSGAVTLLRASPRDKSFLVQDSSGEIALFNATSERRLWNATSLLPAAGDAFFSQKADGALLIADGELASIQIDNPHPEISWKTLFGKVWYEGYDKPEYVWQSTGATDEFESKMSLTPLLVGTLKGTIYSLILAIPLGVFGAMYASQFMHPRLLRYIKPMVEIMAALPSVVLGFLAGLWLAPRLEEHFPALILLLLLLPIFMVAAGMLWSTVPRRIRETLPIGSEILFFIVFLGLGSWLCLALSQPVEATLFGGSFQTWLNETFALPYDQRNAVVIGLAMGFAVIPIIFAISEDAFSNVPKNLVAGSLALGASRWQTVTRVVLPTASPGIFSAIMVGFGRAVGETMIVLMATGNTPIMDWNPFNGFRTLSANIAVEIPEAPQYGTLYRVLFLAALLLFVVTFVVNTAAELIRIRLRRKYAGI